MRSRVLIIGTAAALAVLTAGAVTSFGGGAASAVNSVGSLAGQPVNGGTFGVPQRYTTGRGDTWFNTWAGDGNIYATSNDTTGFNNTCDSDIAINELSGPDRPRSPSPASTA